MVWFMGCNSWHHNSGIARCPGPHLAGHSTFSYFLDPRGNTIDENATPMDGAVAKKSVMNPDRELFVAPPLS